MKKRIAVLATILLAASCGLQNGKQTQKVPEQVTPNVETIVAKTQVVPQESVYSSTVEASITNNIAPQTSGRIRKINVEVGDYVQKNQILAEMDRNQLDQLELQVKNDNIEYERLKSLYAEGGVSKSDFEAAELGYKVRKTNYKNVKENTILRSPITGYVTARNFDRGDMFSMSAPIFTVQQVVPVKLLVGISESEYTKVKKGDSVTITVDALPGRVFKGRVERVYPTIDATTRTFKVEVHVPNTNKLLRPGMYARVTVNFGNVKRVVIPDQAVVRMEGTGQRFVYLLQADSTVSFKPVTLGRHLDATYEILDGIKSGDQVVTKGQTVLKDGVKVNVINQ